MIGLDTNVLIRYAVHDDKEQTAAAQTALKKLTPAAPGFITHVVLAEVWWVLTRTYKIERSHCCAFIADLLDTAEIRIEESDVARKALALAESGADLADALIAESGTYHGCDSTITFDTRAINKAGLKPVESFIS